MIEKSNELNEKGKMKRGRETYEKIIRNKKWRNKGDKNGGWLTLIPPNHIRDKNDFEKHIRNSELMKGLHAYETIIHTDRERIKILSKIDKNEWLKITWKIFKSHENQHIHMKIRNKTQKYRFLKTENEHK